MVMGDITSTADTEYEWMMRLGNCIPALLSICKYTPSLSEQKIQTEIDEVTPGHCLDPLLASQSCTGLQGDNPRLMIISAEMTFSPGVSTMQHVWEC